MSLLLDCELSQSGEGGRKLNKGLKVTDKWKSREMKKLGATGMELREYLWVDREVCGVS